MCEWGDRFAARSAELAVSAGIRVVLFGGLGFPVPGGGQPHAAAVMVSRDAWFGYPASGTVIPALRERSLAGERCAVAFTGQVADPGGLLRCARAAGLPGMIRAEGGVPAQVQLGGVLSYLRDEEGAALMSGYARLLPAGSEVAACVPGGEDAAQLAAVLGMVAHSAAEVVQWMDGAGLDVSASPDDIRSPADVRWWGTWARPEFAARAGVRMIGVVGRVR